MKKHLSLAAVLLFVLTGISGCKKDSLSRFKTDIIGRWEVSKIEPIPELTITSGDYYDFKEGEDDIVEIRRGGQLQSGTYSATASQEINMTVAGKLYTCKVTALDGNRLEFTAAQGSSTEKVYLRR